MYFLFQDGTKNSGKVHRVFTSSVDSHLGDKASEIHDFMMEKAAKKLREKHLEQENIDQEEVRRNWRDISWT